MSMTELDLEKGDPEYEGSSPTESPAQRRRRERESARGSSSSSSGRSGGGGSSSGGSDRSDGGLVTRLVEAFTKIADQIEVRGDDELADALKDDAEKMARGIRSLTRSVKFLRGPLVFVLDVLEPILAFWHVGSILGRRWLRRRERRYMEQEAAREAELAGT